MESNEPLAFRRKATTKNKMKINVIIDIRQDTDSEYKEATISERLSLQSSSVNANNVASVVADIVRAAIVRGQVPTLETVTEPDEPTVPAPLNSMF